MTDRQKDALQHWLQPILSGLVLAAIIWVGQQVTSLREDMSVVQEQVNYESRISEEATERLSLRVEQLEQQYRELRDGTMVEAIERQMESGSEG